MACAPAAAFDLKSSGVRKLPLCAIPLGAFWVLNFKLLGPLQLMFDVMVWTSDTSHDMASFGPKNGNYMGTSTAVSLNTFATKTVALRHIKN
eukprot:6464648-Amphidinium_carterae.1